MEPLPYSSEHTNTVKDWLSGGEAEMESAIKRHVLAADEMEKKLSLPTKSNDVGSRTYADVVNPLSVTRMWVQGVGWVENEESQY